nr:hypothetical protein [Pandoravirus massiliensis]
MTGGTITPKETRSYGKKDSFQAGSPLSLRKKGGQKEREKIHCAFFILAQKRNPEGLCLALLREGRAQKGIGVVGISGHSLHATREAAHTIKERITRDPKAFGICIFFSLPKKAVIGDNAPAWHPRYAAPSFFCANGVPQ